MLWVGHFNENDWTWTDEGRLYEFPRSPDGSTLYGNIEGVGWITPSRVVTVSDRRKKKTQPDTFLEKRSVAPHLRNSLRECVGFRRAVPEANVMRVPHNGQSWALRLLLVARGKWRV